VGPYSVETNFPRKKIAMSQFQDKPPLTLGGLPPVPTTRILAMGHLLSPLTLEQRHTVGAREVPATVRLYLEGKIDQWWYRQDGKGVVFLLNETSLERAQELLESLPFAQAKLLRFELIPVGPLAPLHALLRDAATSV
jgi:hypothetical protein